MQTHPPIAGDTLSDRFELKGAVRLVLRHLNVIASCTALGLLSGLWFTASQTPVYTGTARIEIASKSVRVLQDLELREQANSLRATATARERLKSKHLAEAVVADLALDQKDEFFGAASAPLKVAADSTIEELLERTNRDRSAKAARMVRSGLAIDSVRNTPILAVRFSHPEPELAAAIANQVVASYMELERKRLRKTSDDTREFITRQLTQAEADLTRSEGALIAYAEENGLSIGDTGLPISDIGLPKSKSALSVAIQKRIAAELAVDRMERGGVENLPQSLANNVVEGLKARATELRAEYRMKLARMKPNFPPMRQLESRIQSLEASQAVELAAIERSVRAEAEQARRQENDLRAERDRLEAAQHRTQRAGIGFMILKRQADADRTRYETLTRKLSEVTVSGALAEPGVEVVELSGVPSSPSNITALLNLLASLGIFGALGAGVVVVREATRDAFDTPEEIALDLDMPVLGSVPKTGWAAFDRREADSNSDLREAYRVLRGAVQARDLAGECSVRLVTAAGKGVGSSTTARRLATDIARTGQRVLLIDADLAGDGLHHQFGGSNDAGLATLLDWESGATDVASCFQPTGETGLTLMPSGPVGEETGDRLASDRMDRMLALLRKSFDAIVIDGAPALARAETSSLARIADGTLLVIASDRTKRSAALAATNRLRQAGATLEGAVVTRHKGAPIESALPKVAVRESVVPSTEPAANPVHDMIAAAADGLAEPKRRVA